MMMSEEEVEEDKFDSATFTAPFLSSCSLVAGDSGGGGDGGIVIVGCDDGEVEFVNGVPGGEDWG